MLERIISREIWFVLLFFAVSFLCVPLLNRLGRDMPMSEFKFIYFMEFSHRMLGRVLGVCFGVPLLYFGARGYLTQALKYRLAGLFALGGVQVRPGLRQLLLVSWHCVHAVFFEWAWVLCV
jgi:heme A synthase